jgi:hypothetical protein
MRKTSTALALILMSKRIVFDSGIRLEELSSMLGHTNTATTLHYIRRKEPDKNTAEIVRTVLTA